MGGMGSWGSDRWGPWWGTRGAQAGWRVLRSADSAREGVAGRTVPVVVVVVVVLEDILVEMVGGERIEDGHCDPGFGGNDTSRW